MTTGNALNAKLIIASWYPMPGTKELNKKLLPWSEKLIRVLKTLSTKKNCDFINGTLSIIKPKILSYGQNKILLDFENFYNDKQINFLINFF